MDEGGQFDIKQGNLAMRLRMSVFAAGLAIAFSPAPGEAEVLAINSNAEISAMTTIGDPPLVVGDVDVASEAHSGDLEVQSAPSVSHDAVDVDRGTLAVTAAPALPNWAMTLLSFTGFDR
jgi:hypothetical protein